MKLEARHKWKYHLCEKAATTSVLRRYRRIQSRKNPFYVLYEASDMQSDANASSKLWICSEKRWMIFFWMLFTTTPWPVNVYATTLLHHHIRMLIFSRINLIGAVPNIVEHKPRKKIEIRAKPFAFITSLTNSIHSAQRCQAESSRQ